jgi:hypothetical protein
MRKDNAQPAPAHRGCGRLCGSLILVAATVLTNAAAAGAGDSVVAWLYRDAGAAENRGFWTNVIPADGRRMLRLELADASGPASGATAVRIDIDFAGAGPGGGWCGLVVASAPDYWGDRPGEALDLRGASALVFRARGARGGERIRVKAAIAGDQPFGDSALLPLDTGWIELSPDWRAYRIEAVGRDLSRTVTPFMLIANDKHNPAGGLTVFLDDIRYVAER